VRTALLRGQEHLGLGRVACVAEGQCAIALSQGGAAKTYGHKHPNEDCVGFASGSASTLLALADGHAGCEASQLAIEKLLEHPAPSWTANGIESRDWEALARETFAELHTEIVACSTRSGSEARTTLALALISPEAGHVAWATSGDSHVFRVDDRAEELGAARPEARYFLGSPTLATTDLDLRCGTAPLAGLRAVVLATDGLSERNIGVADPVGAAGAAVERALEVEPRLRPLTAARGLAETALEAQRDNRAGDNIATAVFWNKPV